ncbi:GH36 C-terminal domain-containing protein [Kitasatospora aburaviensis]
MQHGIQYRLTGHDGLTAVHYAARDGAEHALLVWRPTTRFGHPPAPLRLPALDPAARYRDLETGRLHGGAAPEPGHRSRPARRRLRQPSDPAAPGGLTRPPARWPSPPRPCPPPTSHTRELPPMNTRRVLVVGIDGVRFDLLPSLHTPTSTRSPQPASWAGSR